MPAVWLPFAMLVIGHLAVSSSLPPVYKITDNTYMIWLCSRTDVCKATQVTGQVFLELTK